MTFPASVTSRLMAAQALRAPLRRAKWTASMSLGHQDRGNEAILAFQVKGDYISLGRQAKTGNVDRALTSQQIRDVTDKCIA